MPFAKVRVGIDEGVLGLLLLCLSIGLIVMAGALAHDRNRPCARPMGTPAGKTGALKVDPAEPAVLCCASKRDAECARKTVATRTGKETEMTTLTRRSVLRSSLALGAAGALARPYIANAAAKTATVWWTQGFAEEEDISFKKIVADYEKASGNAIDHSITPYAPLRQKIVSAVTSGVVPDLFQNSPAEIIALYAWDDKLVDVSDVVATTTGGVRRDRASQRQLLQ